MRRRRIYTLSNQYPSSRIEENYLHDNYASEGLDYGSSGIYLDEQSDGFSVKNNVHVQSYGGLNLHIVGSRNDIGVNYFFEGDVSSDAYDSFATTKVQQIMDQPGRRMTLPWRMKKNCSGRFFKAWNTTLCIM